MSFRIPPAQPKRRPPNLPSSVTLPDELMAEVLSFLSVKSLMQLRCVNKSFNSLVSDPSFVKMHLNRSARNPHLTLYLSMRHSVMSFPVHGLLECPSNYVDSDRYCRLDDMGGYCLVVGSCNGLICLQGCSCGTGSGESWFCFWNPATRIISERLGSFRYDDNDKPHIRTFRFAFGYDNLTDTYKVVSLPLFRREVKVFSLGGNGWRNIQSFPTVPLHYAGRKAHRAENVGVYLNNSLNWLAFCSDILYVYWKDLTVEQFVIISLDMGTETYIQFRPPRGFDEVPRVEPTLCVLMDSLCFSHHSKGTDFVVWLMMEFGVEESWTQFLKISYQNLQNLHYDFDLLEYLKWLPLHFYENGNTLILASELDHLILYNRRDDRVEQTTNNISWYYSKNYVESLVSTC